MPPPVPKKDPTPQELQKLANKDPEAADAAMDKLGYSGKTSTRIAPQPLVKIRTADGAYGTVPRKDLAQALASDAEVVSDAEFNKAALQKEYGGIGGVAAAGGLGLARGATFGLSDVAGSALGYGEQIDKLQQANPLASMAGEGVGMVAPLALSGGAAAPLEEAGIAARGMRAATAIPRAVGGLGMLAEEGAAKLVGREAESALGRLGQKAVTSGAQAATEGAFINVAQELTDDAIHDKELTAEKLFAAAGKGALFGTVLGGGLGLAGGALEELGTKLASKAEGAIGKTASDFFDEQSAEAAFRAAGGGKKLASKADEFAGGWDRVGKIWRDEAPGLVGEKSFASMDREKLTEAALRGMEKSGGRIDGALTSFDEAALKAGKSPTIRDVVSSIDRTIDSTLQHAGHEPLTARLESFRDSILRLSGARAAGGAGEAALNLDQAISFKQWQAWRKDADALWNEAAKGTSAKFLDLRREMETSMMRKAEEVGAGAALKDYQAAKSDWQAWKYLERATANASAAQGSNRVMSLTDTIAGGAGAAVGGAIGGPVGALAGGGIASGINHLVRTRGDFVMAEGARQLSSLTAAQGAAERMDLAIGNAAKGLLRGARDAGVGLGTFAHAKREKEPTKKKSNNADVDKLARRIATMTAQQATDAIQKHIAPLQPHANQLAGHLSTVASRAMSFLQSKAPKEKSPASWLRPLQPPRMSDIERSEWRDYVTTILDPETVFKDLERGRISRNRVEALKAVYPRQFQQLKDEIQQQAPRLQRNLDMQQKAACSVVFETPIGDMFEPEAVATFQATFGSEEQEAAAGQPAPPKQIAPSNPTPELGPSDQTQMKRM